MAWQRKGKLLRKLLTIKGSTTLLLKKVSALLPSLFQLGKQYKEYCENKKRQKLMPAAEKLIR